MSCCEHVEELIGDAKDFVLLESPAKAKTPLFESFPIEELRDEEDGAIVSRIVVQYPHRALVPDGVRDVAFAQETVSYVLIYQELGMKELHGYTTSVAVRRGIDCCHPAETEQHVQPPLAS
jgi:hypothetical protein